MQRTVIILAYFFICVNCFSQSAGSSGQYPFVHYTPREGLANNRARCILQDSKGKLYISTFAGLSVYNGTRFINYNLKSGLAREHQQKENGSCHWHFSDKWHWAITWFNLLY